MRNLLCKELHLSIHKFFYFLPILIGVLFFIPNWFFTIVPMYLFWITVPQVYSAYIANQDNNFVAALPVTKKDIVLSKSLALITLELLQLVIIVLFSIIHNAIYDVWNFSLDANIAFIGVSFMIYGIFNIAFLPYYFKTGYRFGKPTILGVVSTLLFSALIEYSILRFDAVRNLFEGAISSQVIILGAGIVISTLLSIFAVKISQNRFEKIDL